MDYLIEQYDTETQLSFKNLKDKARMHQWLQFQNTAQGPMLQIIFRFTYTEPNPTARASYIKSFLHVLKVLDDELKEKDWLVGGKCSAADLR